MENRKKFFLDIFPPPDYLNMPVFCVDISDKSLKFIELKRKNGKVLIHRFGTYFLEDGIVEKGEIKQKEKLSSLLKTIKKKIKTTLVSVSLPEEKAFLSIINFPEMNRDKIKEAISFQLEEYVPLPSAEAIFDIDILDNALKESEQGFLRLNITAFPKSFVELYRDVFIEAGFIPVSFEMEAQSFVRAVVPSKEEDNVMVIDFGKTRTTFVVVIGGKIQFATTVAIAGEDIENALVFHLKIGKSQIESAKREIGLLKSKDKKDLFEALKATVLVLKNEVIKQMTYWLSHNDGNQKDAKITKIILCGGESTLVGLPELLSCELKIKVELGNPWINVVSFDEYIPNMDRMDSLAYSTAIGLAIKRWVNKYEFITRGK